MLWCSYFRSLINWQIFPDVEISLNFVSTPLKIIIPLGNSVGGPYKCYRNPSVGNDFSFYAKVSLFDNLVKKLTLAGVVRKNIWFSLPVPKIKFDPPPQGNNALVFIF